MSKAEGFKQLPRLGKMVADEFKALQMRGSDANAAYTDAIREMGGVIDPGSALAAREAALGLTPTTLNITKLPTGLELSKRDDLKEIENVFTGNNLGFFDRTVGKSKAGIDWYDDANVEARAIGQAMGFQGVGKQEDVGAAILALLSPKTKWQDNVNMGRRAGIGLRRGEIQKLAEDMQAQGVTNFADAREAGIFVPPTAKKLNPQTFTKLIKVMDSGTGIGTLRNYDDALKIDSFFGAIRLPAVDRRALMKLGVMDKYERILDPDYIYKGVRLGDLSTKPTIDKFEAIKSLAASGLGYKFPFTTIDDVRGYDVFANALARAARERNLLTPEFQAMDWMKLHELYPKGSPQIMPPTIADSLKAYEQTKQVPEYLLPVVRNAIARGEVIL